MNLEMYGKMSCTEIRTTYPSRVQEAIAAKIKVTIFNRDSMSIYKRYAFKYLTDN